MNPLLLAVMLAGMPMDDGPQPAPTPDDLRKLPEFGYVGQRITQEHELLAAIRVVKDIGHHEDNWIRPGEDLRGTPPKEGVVVWQHNLVKVGTLEPWVRISMLPRGASTALRLTYQVRVVDGEARRELAVELDVLSATTAPVMRHDVLRDAQGFYDGVGPIVKQFWPLHDHVAANIDAADPVPRGNADTRTVHMRTAVQMRFAVPHETISAPPKATKRRVQLFGPDGRPV
jgi:hypothetical protein